MGEKKQVTSITDAKERDQAFEMARGQIEKQFGKGAILRLGENTVQNIGIIPSGSLMLDRALGVGGYPRGRIIEIFGPESSGKTTLALHAIAEAQKLGGTAAFIDAEHAIDPKYAKALGVDVDTLWISQPDNGEQALEITEHLVRSGAVDIIVIDSVAALTPKAEIAGLMGDAQMGNQARLMSQALRKLTGIISKTSCSLIFINQIRMKIGVMFGSPETTTGGNALKFYATVRIDIRRVDRISQGADNYIGNKVRVKIAKNKVAPPFKEATFAIYFGKGISREENILDLAVDHDLVQKTGSWYTVGEQRIQGKEASIQYLAEHPDYGKELENKIRSIVFASDSTPATSEASSDTTDNSKELSDETNTAPSESKTSPSEVPKASHEQKKAPVDDQAQQTSSRT